jgi:DNA-binding CsgD family transcriptional regulator
VCALLAQDARPGPRPPHHNLTPREAEIVSLIGAGLQIKQVAAELGISISSVNTYRSRIFRKMGMSTNAALIRYALQHGLAG